MSKDWNIYLRSGRVLIPRTCKVRGAGFYTFGEPVFTCDKHDNISVARSVQENMEIGNPIVESTGDAVLLKHAKVRSYKTFQKGAFLWNLGERDGKYFFGIVAKRSDRGWEGAPKEVHSFPPGTTEADVAGFVAEAISAFNEREEN